MIEPVVGNSSNSAIYRINMMYGRKDLPGTNRGVESSPSKELYSRVFSKTLSEVDS
jgi:hypothetical protein